MLGNLTGLMLPSRRLHSSGTLGPPLERNEGARMSRYRIKVTQTVELEQEDLQASAIAFPTLQAAVPDPDVRMAQASDPENAAQMMALEMRNQLLYMVPNSQAPMPEVQIDAV